MQLISFVGMVKGHFRATCANPWKGERQLFSELKGKVHLKIVRKYQNVMFIAGKYGGLKAVMSMEGSYLKNYYIHFHFYISFT